MAKHQGPGRRLLIGASIAAVLLLVWSAGQLAGLMVHGSWPRVSFLWSVVELVRACGGGEPAAGIPVALFWLCLLLEVGTALVLNLTVRRRLHGGHRHV